MTPTLRTAALAIAIGVFGLVGSADNAHAAPQTVNRMLGRQTRTPEETKAALIRTAEKAGIPHVVTPSGKVVYNPHTQRHLSALEKLSKPNTGIVQILKIEGSMHTLGHFEGKWIHFQRAAGTNNWRLRPWANRLNHRDRRMYGAMIQLSPEEADNLRERIKGIFKEEGPERRAGNTWENGHIKDSVGVSGFNCSSGWCGMPIGEKGESLAQVIGIPSSGYPSGLQRSLETGGNEKVIGIGLFGSVEPNLGQNPNQTYTR